MLSDYELLYTFDNTTGALEKLDWKIPFEFSEGVKMSDTKILLGGKARDFWEVGSLYSYNIETGEIERFDGGFSNTSCICKIDDENALIVREDGSAAIVDIENNELEELVHPRKVRSDLLICAKKIADDKILLGGRDGFLSMIDLDSKEATPIKIDRLREPIVDICQTADGSVFLIVPSVDDLQIIRFDVDSASLLTAPENRDVLPNTKFLMANDRNALLQTQDSQGWTFCLYDLEEGRNIWTGESPEYYFSGNGASLEENNLLVYDHNIYNFSIREGTNANHFDRLKQNLDKIIQK